VNPAPEWQPAANPGAWSGFRTGTWQGQPNSAGSTRVWGLFRSVFLNNWTHFFDFDAFSSREPVSTSLENALY
jgi:hypothetical protein